MVKIPVPTRGVNVDVKTEEDWTRKVITAPIVGATKPHHLEDAVAALSLKLAPEDIKALEEPYKPKRVMGHT